MEKFTSEQVIEFMKFCDRHQIKFNFLDEFESALAQYFKD